MSKNTLRKGHSGTKQNDYIGSSSSSSSTAASTASSDVNGNDNHSGKNDVKQNDTTSGEEVDKDINNNTNKINDIKSEEKDNENENQDKNSNKNGTYNIRSWFDRPYHMFSYEDKLLLLGAIICDEMRVEVLRQLGYTCSGWCMCVYVYD